MLSIKSPVRAADVSRLYTEVSVEEDTNSGDVITENGNKNTVQHTYIQSK